MTGIISLQILASSQAAIVWRDDFIDDEAGFLPVIRPAGTVPGDTEDFGISWTDLGGTVMAHATGTGFLSLDGSGSGQGVDGIDSGIRGNFANVEIDERFAVNFDVDFGAGTTGTHLAIGDSLTDNGSNIIGDGFFGVRFIKGGVIENWDGTDWTFMGTVAGFSNMTVELTMNETKFDISVGGTLFTGQNYASARTQLGGMELAFAGNNGSSSQTGLISGSNLGVVPEPSSALFCCLSIMVLLGIRRRGKDS